ncbi:hypothetical protein B0H16DRAFT_1484098 [Mycena metata]|uniref:Uncharacterized protein n=1 Tax=Mycena metata TaxID=1033252 RepID=A0AAD7DV82_9AGAR|nr:hypothetical protein B0H16DRAFT_1484098 [Mycena metata]
MVFRLENTITTLRKTLNHAMLNCPRDRAGLSEMGCQLTQVELSLTGIRQQLLDISGLLTWKIYFQGLREIFKTITECNKEVKDIDTSVLHIMEGEHECRLRMRMEEQRDILNTLMGHVEDVGLPSLAEVASHFLKHGSPLHEGGRSKESREAMILGGRWIPAGLCRIRRRAATTCLGTFSYLRPHEIY